MIGKEILSRVAGTTVISLVSRLVNNFKFSSYDVGKWRRGDVEYVGESRNSSGGVSFLGRYRLVEIGNIRGRDGNDGWNGLGIAGYY